jgi:hypothetical protein
MKVVNIWREALRLRAAAWYALTGGRLPAPNHHHLFPS